MKVLHINCNYMDSWLHQTMVDELELLGVQNSVFVPLYSMEGHIITPKNHVNAAVCFKKWDRIAYHYKQRKIYERLKRDYNLKEFSCLHAYTVFTDGNVTRHLANEFNLPYVVAVRNTDVNIFFNRMPYLRSTGVRVLKDAKAVFFLSETYMDQIFDKYIPTNTKDSIAKKSYVIPNGIDKFWNNHLFISRNYGEIEKRILKKQIKLVYVGGIDKNKNIIETCKAIEILRSDNWHIDFIVVGKIKSHAVFETIEPYITYFEVRPKEELLELYREADIFVMPSFTETFGLVYAEAMSQGLPVIYGKGQGFDKQFEEGVVGYKVDQNNPGDLAEKIVQICKDYTKISHSCIDKAKMFCWKAIVKKYTDIYFQITK